MTVTPPRESQRNATLYRLGEWLIAWRAPVALAALLVTAALAVPALRIELSTSFGDLLPYRHPFVAVHEKWAAQFGGANNLTIMVEAREGTVFDLDTLQKIFRLTEEVDRLPGINHDQIDSIGHRTARHLKMQGGVITMPPVMRGYPATDWHANEVREIVHHNEHLHGILVSIDDRAALVRANFHEGKVDYRKVFDQVNEKVIAAFDDERTRVWVAGEPRLYGWVYAYAGEIYLIFGACVVLLWAMLYAYFRDWRGALRPTLTAVISAIWGLGIIRLLDFPIDPLALVIPFFATARALSHSVQMHDRYYEEYRKNGWRKEPAIVASFAELFVPTLSGITTDALGMLVIILVPVLILQRIAIWASIWVASVAISELLLNPIIYSYLRPPDPERVLAREQGLFQRLVDRWAAVVSRPAAAGVLVGVWALVFIVALSQWRHLTVGDPTSASPLLYADSPYNEAHLRIQEFFGGVEPLIVVVEGKEKEVLNEPEVADLVEAFQRHVDSDPEVGYSVSLADIVKSTHMVFFDMQPRYGVIPARRGPVASLYFFRFAGSSVGEISKWVDLSYTHSHVTFYCRNHKGDTVARIVAKAREFIEANPSEKIELRLAGGLVGMVAAANEEILRNEVLMNLLGYGTIFLVILFTYRSFTAAALMMVPLVLANAVATAYMGFRNTGINLHSLPVITVGIGFGIDYALYVTSRTAEELRGSGDLSAAVARAVSTAGKAITFTVLSFAVATLTWGVSEIRFNAEMGLLLFLWMLVSFLASVTLLPALLVRFRPRFLFREAGIPVPSRTGD